MRICVLFTLFIFAVIGNCRAQALSSEAKETIIGYSPKVRKFVGKPNSLIDTVRYREIIQIETPYDKGEVVIITPYVWNSDTTPIFIDSLAITDNILKDFLTEIIKPKFDTLNHRFIYESDKQISVLQIDTAGNETIIMCYYMFK